MHRFKKHLQDLRAGRHVNNHLQYSWNKHRESNFEISIVEETLSHDLYERESFYINYFNSNDLNYGYNLASPDNNHISSEEYRKMLSESQKRWWSKNKREKSDETKRKISESLLGRKLNENHRNNIKRVVQGDKNPFYGKKHSESTKKIISEKIKGHLESEETRKKKSEAIKLKWQDPEFREKMKEARKRKQP